ERAGARTGQAGQRVVVLEAIDGRVVACRRRGSKRAEDRIEEIRAVVGRRDRDEPAHLAVPSAEVEVVPPREAPGIPADEIDEGRPGGRERGVDGRRDE